jgi:predicted secreted hydrolase
MTGHALTRSTAGAAWRVFVVAIAASLLAACGTGSGPEPAGGDFAVLAQADAAYEQARPGTPLIFPGDHGPHPGYRIEWWYLTANLVDEQGRDWGLQWTLFRTAMRPPESTQPGANPWQASQVYMAHFAISAPDGHRSFQRYARGGDHGGLRQAGAQAQPFAAWLDDWRLESTGESWLPLRLFAAQDGVEADLVLDSDRPLVLQGEAGFSQKHPAGGGSFYYSQPWLGVSGVLRVGGERIPVSGQAWLDREWSSQFLQDDQSGWDWFALHLDSGDKLMAFQLRGEGGDAYRHGVLLRPDGGRVVAESEDIQLTVRRRGQVAGRELPLGWRLAWPEADIELDVDAGLDDQWMSVDFPYWEGRVTVSGAGGDRAGVGYLEMTGYAPVP